MTSKLEGLPHNEEAAPEPGASRFLDYDDCSTWARREGIKSESDWRKRLRRGGVTRPVNVPAHPDRVYRGRGWEGWAAFLGRERRETSEFMSFEACRAWAREMGVASEVHWKAMSREGRRPSNVPAHPERVYAEWSGWPDFRGHSSSRPTSGKRMTDVPRPRPEERVVPPSRAVAATSQNNPPGSEADVSISATPKRVRKPSPTESALDETLRVLDFVARRHGESPIALAAAAIVAMTRAGRS